MGVACLGGLRFYLQLPGVRGEATVSVDWNATVSVDWYQTSK